EADRLSRRGGPRVAVPSFLTLRTDATEPLRLISGGKRKSEVQHKNPFIEPCLPTLAKEPPAGPAWVHEVKFDGYRLQVHKERKDVALLSKNGNDFTSRFRDIAIAAALIATKSVILDCELTACADDGTPDF